MQYGHFDDQRKEYVIDRPDTPRSWTNYLGSTEYGAIITNNAGGYSFYKSGGQGRFTRIRFNSIPLDQPGRYIYLRDRQTADYWSASWQPVGKPLDTFKSECRHGSGYTVISSEYAGIHSQVTYFVPLGQIFEVWHLKVTNTGKEMRKLSAFTYVEYAASWNAVDDLLNLQYVMYTAKMNVVDGIIDHGTNVNIPHMPDNFAEKDQGRHTFLAFTGGEIKGFDTDQERFLGHYRTYANPEVVEKGLCTNSLAAGDNVCGTIQIDIELQAGETRDLVVLMGVGEAAVEGKKAVAAYSDPIVLAAELEKVRAFWHNRIQALTTQTPDAEFNSMLNMWSPYNCQITFNWARAASMVYTAHERDGLGYRDSVQDLLGVIPNTTDEAGKRLELMITGQVSTGGAMPVVNKVAHKPGNEKLPSEEAYRSDDCLWLFNAIPAYVKETGDLSFYRKVLPYADKGQDSVLGHMRRAIQFNLDRSGAHGLPCGLLADWNDCLKFGHNGESVFVAMQLRLAFRIYIEVCEMLGEVGEKAWAEPLLKQLDANIQQHAWDGQWFMRGYRYDGMKFGAEECEEGKIFLNPQAWAIMSGAASDQQALTAMKQVHNYLFTEFGVKICEPAYSSKTDWQIVRAALMNQGMKENGGIFTHTQGWAVIAETMLGNGNQAYEYWRAYMPAAYNTRAEIRQIEPYVYNQSTHSNHSPRYGNSRISWLSGSAAWSYYAATHHILGIQPEYGGLTIDPCVPSDWKEFSMTRRFRGKLFNIKVLNPEGKQKGVKSLTINGQTIQGATIPQSLFQDTNDVTVNMG